MVYNCGDVAVENRMDTLITILTRELVNNRNRRPGTYFKISTSIIFN